MSNKKDHLFIEEDEFFLKPNKKFKVSKRKNDELFDDLDELDEYETYGFDLKQFAKKHMS